MDPALEAPIRGVVISPVRAIAARPAALAPRSTSPHAQSAASTDGRARRIVNVTLALIGIILMSPVLLIVAVLVKATSPGPVLYTQTRVGVDRRNPSDRSFDGRRKVDFGGKLFRIYKFRTMRVASDRLVQIWAERNDSRITPLGAVLRRYRIDELPQLFNVLKGEMNLVGPRPEQPNIFMMLRSELDRYPERQRVLPGITGWAQVSHDYDRSIDDVRKKLRYDLKYVEGTSSVLDLWILAKTIPVVLLRRGGW